MKKFFKGFGYALRGMLLCFAGERNFRFHVVFACFVFYLSRFFGLTASEYAILAFACGLVIFAEAINTAIEHTVDLACDKIHPTARNAKDISAGAVLITALTAIAVGILLLCRAQGFANMYDYYSAALHRPILLALAIVAGFVVVFVIPEKKKKK